LAFLAVAVAIAVVMAVRGGWSRPRPVCIGFLGVTNGVRAGSDATWVAFGVTNLSADPVGYAGGQREIKKDSEWVASPAEEQSPIGWMPDPSRFWHTSPNPIPPGTVFRIFVAVPPGTNPWRAKLAFARHRRVSQMEFTIRRWAYRLGLAIDWNRRDLFRCETPEVAAVGVAEAGSANGSPPIRPETNRTPSAAGSPR